MLPKTSGWAAPPAPSCSVRTAVAMSPCRRARGAPDFHTNLTPLPPPPPLALPLSRSACSAASEACTALSCRRSWATGASSSSVPAAAPSWRCAAERWAWMAASSAAAAAERARASAAPTCAAASCAAAAPRAASLSAASAADSAAEACAASTSSSAPSSSPSSGAFSSSHSANMAWIWCASSIICAAASRARPTSASAVLRAGRERSPRGQQPAPFVASELSAPPGPLLPRRRQPSPPPHPPLVGIGGRERGAVLQPQPGQLSLHGLQLRPQLCVFAAHALGSAPCSLALARRRPHAAQVAAGRGAQRGGDAAPVDPAADAALPQRRGPRCRERARRRSGRLHALHSYLPLHHHRIPCRTHRRGARLRRSRGGGA